MASSKRERLRTAQQTGRVVQGANFETKRARKARRKRQVTAFLANRAVDARLGLEDRAAFYRRLRMVKIRRRLIAKGMEQLAVLVSSLRREVVRIDDRGWALMRETDDRGAQKLVDETAELTREADIAVGVAAAEFYAFSRARIFYQRRAVSV